jgi:serine/threonine-protein kinase
MTMTGTTIGWSITSAPSRPPGGARPPSDIYALGIVMYEMLSGRRPFEGDSAAGVALKRLNEPPPPLSTGILPIPGPLEAVVMQALARDPAQRYATAADFAIALRTWASGEATAVTPVVPPPVIVPVVDPPVEHMPPPPAAAVPPPLKKGTPWWIWVLALLAVLMLGAMGFLGARLLGAFGPEGEPSPSADVFDLPNWVGDPIAAVRLQAEDLNLVLDEQPEASSDVEKDTVISTDPRPGQQVTEGDTIVVVVSAGEETVKVPVLIGQNREEARDTLVAADLQLGLVSEETSDQPEGTVIRSNPASGTEVATGSQVDIVLSSGPTPTPVPTPTPAPTPTPPPPPSPT